MHWKNKGKRYRKRHLALVRYSAKRRTSKWVCRKKNNKLGAFLKIRKRQRQVAKPYLSLAAPKEFSLIQNTSSVLEYFEDAETHLKSGENIIFDISDVDELSPDTIALLVASIHDVEFTHGSNIRGNAPKKTDLLKLFTGSGFYEHVQPQSGLNSFTTVDGNLLHKEVNHKVDSATAKAASIVGIRNTLHSESPFEPLYEILVECMSNTNNHADLHVQGKCNWWLYVYSDPKNSFTSYSFVDLGVGIFKSVVVQNYLKNYFKGSIIYPNIMLVDDLLAGRVQSRIEKDNEIRGKGIPQIVEHAKLPNFRRFYIISNDVKIDLKTMQKEQLSHSLKGTLLYWELQK